MRLDGRVAIVAGAGSGIGAAIAQRFAEAGAQVIGADIERAAVDSLAAKVTGLTARTCDATDSVAVDALIDGAVQRVAKKYLTKENRSVVTTMPPKPGTGAPKGGQQ